MQSHSVITNDATVLGILFLVLGVIYYTSHSEKPVYKKFYKYVPALLLCYFIPGVLNSIGFISGESSKLYFVSSRYLLPACLVLLTLSVDIKGIINLGPKAIIMFLTGTFGIMVGGPIAMIISKAILPGSFEKFGSDQVWRGMTTVAGSWIGGGANQAAMKEVFAVSDKLFSSMIVVDVLVATAWMAVLLFLTGKSKAIDEKTKADTTAIEALKVSMEKFIKKNEKIPTHYDLMIVCVVAFSCTGLSHFIADLIAPFIKTNAPGLAKFSLTSSFFWLIIIATTLGLGLSFTRMRKLEGVGASKVGTIFLYILVASIGMHMNIGEIFSNIELFLIGVIWMSIHATLLIVVAKIIKAPFFFLAVGSQANVGGAASAPVVAAAFHPSLAPVGVLLAVFGYILGTYGAWLCGILMKSVS